MKGKRANRSIKGGAKNELQHTYAIRKSVSQGIPLSKVDVDLSKVEGGIWPFLIPLLAGLGVKAAEGIGSVVGNWFGKKVTGQGLIRAGDKRPGAGLIQAGSARGGLLRGTIPPQITESSRAAKTNKHKFGEIPEKTPEFYLGKMKYKFGDVPAKSGRITRSQPLRGGAIPDAAKVAKMVSKLKPFLANNDKDGFQRKLIKYAAGKN